MKNFIYKLTFLYVLQPAYAFAETDANEAFRNSSAVPKKDIIELLNPIITAILGIAATIAVLIIILGGLQYITAAGNPETIQKSKGAVTNAVIGLIATILAYALITFILNNVVR